MVDNTVGKFQYNYYLKIETNKRGEFLEVRPPLTIDFSIAKNTLASITNGTISIYNLNKYSRKSIQKDSYEYSKLGRTIELLGGYGNNLYSIFKGNILSAQSERQGTDFVTTVECYDGGYAKKQGYISKTFQKGTPYLKVVESLVATLSDFGVTKGAIGEVLGETTRAISLEGYAYDLLIHYTGGNCFIADSKVYVLNNREFTGDYIPEINADTGILGTPVVEETKLKFSMIFEPRINAGQLIKVNSSTTSSEKVNGEYKVTSVTHRGTFSDGVSSSVVTEIGCAFGLAGFKRIFT